MDNRDLFPRLGLVDEKSNEEDNKEYYDRPNFEALAYDKMLEGDSKQLCTINMILSIIYLVFTVFFLLILRSFLSFTLCALGIINMTFSIIQMRFFKWKCKNTNWYTTFLYFNDICIWSMASISLYLAINLGTVILPIKTLASDRYDWMNHYFDYMISYEIIYTMTIATVVILILLGLSIAIISIILFYFMISSTGERFDRLITSFVILQAFFAFAIGYLLCLDIIWKIIYFALLLSFVLFTTVIFLFVFLYFGIYRYKYDQNESLNKKIYSSIIVIFGLHILIAILVFCNLNKLYLKSYIDFPNNFDYSYVRRMFNENKFYSVGSLDDLSFCPKELIMPSWEDYIYNYPYGCLNLKAYYKCRSLLSFILDLTIMLPLFDIMIIIIIFNIVPQIDDFNDPIKNTEKYQRYHEKFRVGFTLFFLVGLIILTTILFIFGTKTTSIGEGYDLNRQKIDYSIYDRLIPPNDDYNYLDKEKEYIITGTIVTDDTINIFQLIPKDKKIDTIQIPIIQNYPFKINMYAYKFNYPVEYILELHGNKTFLSFQLIFGGSLTGKEINLGKIPLYIEESIGKVKGYVKDSENSEKILKEVEIFVIKGIHYPSYENLLFDSIDNFKINDFYNYTVSSANYGYYQIENLPQGYYTLVFVKKNYYIETLQVSIYKNNTQFFHTIFLTKQIKKYRMNFALEWPSGPRDLDLIVTFFNRGIYWSISNLNNFDGVYHIVQNNNGGNEGIEMVQLKEIYKYLTYSISVYQFNNTNDEFIKEKYVPGLLKEQRYSGVDEVSLNNSKAKIKVYVSEIRYPLLNAQVPIDLPGNEWKAFNYSGYLDFEL